MGMGKELITMDDLISRKAIMNEAKRISGPMTGDGWDNWGVYALIERQPSITAVPLEPLCNWLSGYAICPDYHYKPYDDYLRNNKNAWKTYFLEKMKGWDNQ